MQQHDRLAVKGEEKIATLISAVPSSGGFAAMNRSIHSYIASYSFLFIAESLQNPVSFAQQPGNSFQSGSSQHERR